MVSRSQTPGQGIQSAAVGFQQLGKTARETGGVLRSNILPALGLSAAFGILSGSMAGAGGAGYQASSAMLGLNRAFYDLQNALAPVAQEIVEAVTPAVEGAVDAILAADRATDGWSTKLGLAGIAAGTLYAKVRPLRTAVNAAAKGLASVAANAGRFAYGAAAGGRIGAGASTAAYRGALAGGALADGSRAALQRARGFRPSPFGGVARSINHPIARLERAFGFTANRPLAGAARLGSRALRLGGRALGPVGALAGLGGGAYLGSRNAQGGFAQKALAFSEETSRAAISVSGLGDEIADKIVGGIKSAFGFFGGGDSRPAIQVQGYTDEQLLAKMEELIASGAIGPR